MLALLNRFMNKRNLIIACFLVAVSGVYAQKLSPNAEALLMHRPGAPAFTIKADGDTLAVKQVKVFIELDDIGVLEQIERLGGKVYTDFGNCVTASVPVASLRDISELEGIKFIEMGSPVNLLMDKARVATGVDIVHLNSNKDLPNPYTGKGVVIGIIDTGMEYGHLDFYTSDGKECRLKRVWNQNGIGRAPADFRYGVEYTTTEEILSARVDTEGEYHGSHVAGIATGADKKSGYHGVAPDADIVFVSFGQNSVDIPNAVKYIFDYAESVGKPCVINMSLGSHMGPHDGTSTIDRFFDSVVGPGRILVGAAGNEGGKRLHVHKTFTEDDKTLKTILGFASSTNKNTLVDIWGSSGSEFTVKMVIVDTFKGKTVAESEEVSSTGNKSIYEYFYPDETGVDCTVKIVPVENPVNGAPNIYVEAYVSGLASNRSIGIVVNGEAGSDVHMWNATQNDFVNGGLRGWTAGVLDGSVGEIGGTSQSVISTGSYNTRFNFPLYMREPGSLYMVSGYGEKELPIGAISSFSSYGPTADGRTKPDVLAPGALVVSAVNKYALSDALANLVQRTYSESGNAYYYDINIGTSMASPVVTGTVALWLQANPDLTPDDIRDVIKSTSVSDSNTGSVPNNRAGYGRLDAYAGLKHILTKSGVDGIGSGQGSVDAWVERGSRNICISLPASVCGGEDVEVYTVTGARVGIYHVGSSYGNIDASSWASGVYVLRFLSDGSSVKVVL